MSDELFAFDAAQVARLTKVVNSVELNDQPRPSGSSQRPRLPSRIIIGLLTNSVSATTSLTGKPKVGTLNVYSFSSTGVEDTGLDETVYNFAPQAATTDRWTVAERDDVCGKFAITTQFCS
jgi:hypothetical protein